MQDQLTDSCLMPFGKHKDKEMQDVPADYLIFVYNENKGQKVASKSLQKVMEYIEDNLNVLNVELKKQKR